MRRQVVDGISDELSHASVFYDTEIEDGIHELDGIYFSELTERMFIARVEKDVVLITYTDSEVPRIDKKINIDTFQLQLRFGVYEALCLCK